MKTRKIVGLALAIVMLVSISSFGAFAAEAETPSVSRITSRVVSASQLALLHAASSSTVHHNGASIMLPRSNSSGTNGAICGNFTADTTKVTFTLNTAPNTTTYNVQIYDSNGSPIRMHETINLGSGAYFDKLTVGTSYYFKVSSYNCPTAGCNATYTVETYS